MSKNVIGNDTNIVSLNPKDELKEAFSVIYDKIGSVKLNEISPGLGDRDIDLTDLVVPLRSDITISARVNENGLEEVSVHRVSSSSKPLAIIRAGELQDIKKLYSPKRYQKYVSRINSDFVAELYESVKKILSGQTVSGLSIRHRPLIFAPLWKTGEKEEFANVNILSAANLFQYVVILGAPGSGKTTSAKAIAAAHLSVFLGEDENSNRIKGLGLWNDTNHLPIYIDLKSMVSDKHFPQDVSTPPNVEFFKEYVYRTICKDNNSVKNYYLKHLQDGDAILILDGLDEVPIPTSFEGAIEFRQTQLQSLIRSIRTVFSKIKIIVTSRPAGYSGWTLDGFETIRILPLSSNEAKSLAYSYYIAAGENKEESKNLSKQLLVEIERLPEKIREYPLFICLLASLYRDKKGSFPAKRGGLLKVSLDTLLVTWTMKRHQGKSLKEILNCTAEEIVTTLATISYRALSEIGINGRTDTPDVPISMALEEFYYMGQSVNPTEVLNYIMNQAGIWTSPAHGKLRFVHRLFQEYLAALYVTNSSDKVGLMTKLVIDNPVLWFEVALLFSDIMANSGSYIDLIFFIEQLLKNGNECKEPSRIISLAASIIVDEEFDQLPSSHKESVAMKICINNLCDLLSSNKYNFDGEQRYIIGLAINELGDPRKGVSINNNIPEFAWKRVEGGTFQMGTCEKNLEDIEGIEGVKKWNLNREMPMSQVSVGTFDISIYPVTKKQFYAFVLADDGYNNDEWWSENGLAWRDNNSPPPTVDLLPDNAPQNCVTWYEAVAFCNWCSFKLNSNIRLPTEAEWEYAARGINHDYQFAWGNDCNVNFANVIQTKIGKVSPVGCFPTNDVGVFDLNGNLWEWCSTIVEVDSGTKYSYPYNKEDGREELNHDDHCLRATRGGYYGGEWMYARSCYRGRDIPSLRAERQGFRVVKSYEG